MTTYKQLIAVFVAATMGAATVSAQQIALVKSDGGTTVCQTLQKAIEEADGGSVIYLPGGGFQIHDSVKITKPVSIIGIGYKAQSENPDGNTTLSGNLFFNEGSSGSSVMGCFISGTVYIGNDGNAVHNIVVKYCNLNSVNVNNSKCTGTVVNQNYIRNASYFNSAGGMFTNNVASGVSDLVGGKIVNNIFKYGGSFRNSAVTRNIFLDSSPSSSECLYTENMGTSDIGDNPKNISEIGWEKLFVKYNGGNITPASDFHFVDTYQKEYRNIGIYGGTKFTESCQPPLPFIVERSIPGQTDASENLNITIRVKAGE